MADAGADPQDVECPRPATPLTSVVARLSGLNGLVLVLSLVTGPVLARSLGVEGRGQYAVTVTVLILVPTILDFGLADWVAREAARGRGVGGVLATAAVPASVCAVLGMAAGYPLSRVFGQGSSEVERLLLFLFLTMPVWVMAWLLNGVARGLQAWRVVTAQRLLTGLGGAIGVVALATLDELTVTSATLVAVTAGLASTVVVLPLLRGGGRWTTDRRAVKAAVSFGAHSWVAMISTQANNRLDQLMMAALVSSRELGLYAVAVSLVSIVFGFVGAMSTALLPYVASHGRQMLVRIVRVSGLVIAASLACIALVAPFVVPVLFGAAFSDSVRFVVILAVATWLSGLSSVLAAGLQGQGRPDRIARPYVLGMLVMIVGLAALLPSLGGVGAALANVVCYAVVLTGLVRSYRAVFGCSARQLLVPTRGDLRWMGARFRLRS